MGCDRVSIYERIKVYNIDRNKKMYISEIGDQRLHQTHAKVLKESLTFNSQHIVTKNL